MRASRLLGFLLCMWLGACVGAIDVEPRRGLPTSGTVGVAGGPSPSSPTSPPPAAGAAGVKLPSASLRRLTVSQYQNSIRDLLGTPLDASKLSELPPLNGLRAIATSSLALAATDVETFDALADSVTAQVFADGNARQALVGCDASQSACAESFIANFGRRAFRRPLGDDERTRYLALLRTATMKTADGWLGLRVVTSAMLESPLFLYREELGVPDSANAARRLLTGYQVASRLSFLIWNTTPDNALLDAAAAGMLDQDAGLISEAKRLLASPRAADAIQELFSDFLQLDALDDLVKLPEIYPLATPTIGPAMKQETLLSMRKALFERALDFRTAFTTNTTYVDAELAKLYAISKPRGTGLSEVTLPANGPRAGLLTQASFLASHAHPGRTSPTRRGKFVRENLMCQSIPAPPPGVNTNLGETITTQSLRQKLEQHRADPACAGCHALMDPIGLALEHFDGIGAYRERENGAAIDASGELDGVHFDDARGLGSALAGSANVTSCFARTLLRYARGALEDPSETELIASTSTAFEKAGFRVPDLMLQIATSAAFRQVGAVQ